jgi:hypothetical protein
MSSQHDDGRDGQPAPPAPLPAPPTEWAPASPGAAAPPPQPPPPHASEPDPQPTPRPPAPAPGPAPSMPPPSPTYAPPPSPTYAPPAPTAPTYVPPAPSTAPPPPAPPLAPPARRGGRRRLLVGSGLVVVAAVVAGVVAVTGGDDDDPGYAFGEVGAAAGGAVARPGDDAEERPLAVGDSVRAGWVVEAAGDAAVTLELAGGGVVRFDSGARLTFADLAVDPETGEASGPSEPAIEIAGGRVWVNPAGDAASAAIEVRIPEAVVETTGNPVALDCTAACSVEAPAGGVTATSSADKAVTPAANEVVTLETAETFDLTVGDGPSAWAQQNLDADGDADLPAPEPDGAPGIRGSAVLGGTYVLALDVTGAPAGDAIPVELQYAAGEAYTISLDVDGGACAAVPCDVPVSAPDGATGTAHVGDGTVALSFSQPIDCYDETFTTVVVPGIGTTTVTATLAVDDVDQDGDRWLVRTFDGTGTVAATLSTPCNPGDTLGTSTSPITIAGS